jgi:hypothetical protein
MKLITENQKRYIKKYPIKGAGISLFLVFMVVINIILILIFGGLLIILDKEECIANNINKLIYYSLGNSYREFMGYI